MSHLLGTFGAGETKQWTSGCLLCGGFMKICDDFWSEFLKWAIAFKNVKQDADIYDVFEWLRQRQPGSGPYSDAFLARIDKQVERECGPWT